MWGLRKFIFSTLLILRVFWYTGSKKILHGTCLKLSDKNVRWSKILHFNTDMTGFTIHRDETVFIYKEEGSINIYTSLNILIGLSLEIMENLSTSNFMNLSSAVYLWWKFISCERDQNIRARLLIYWTQSLLFPKFLPNMLAVSNN